jgi:competence protein ComEA
MPSVARMSSRRPTPDHQEAVSRRLALLSAELAGVRPEPPGLPGPPGPQEPPEADGWAQPHTRIRPVGPPASPPASPDPGPPAVPVPGRHASRRQRMVGDVVPSTLRGRVTLGPAQLTVVAVLVAAGLAVTCWWVVRGDADRLEAPALEPTAAAGLVSGRPLAAASPVAADASTSPAGAVTVDVSGKVRHPGIAVLDAGARVVDALKAAGGARPGVDLSGLNLARVLVDGEQVLVGRGVTPGGLAGAASSAAPATDGALVNLNTATSEQLDTLPGVGPVTAEKILDWRTAHGAFASVDELLEVDGIGEKTLADLAPHVTL